MTPERTTMALTLNELYHSTKNKYHLELMAGADGLTRIMNWVYISEDLNTAEFLQGGELIITTGMSCKSSENWLYNFISNMIEHETCGVIINIGQYLKPKDISDNIKQLCEQNHFSLFTMPWNVHIYDITRDYYNRIFVETQADNTITNAFVSIIRKDNDCAKSINILEDNGFSATDHYCVCVLAFGLVASTNKLRFIIESYIHKNNIKCHIAIIKNVLLLLCNDDNLIRITRIMEGIQTQLNYYDASQKHHIGIGSIMHSLADLNTSYTRSIAALTMCKYNDQDIFNYEDMGFFKLLLSVNDTDLLQNYVHQHLGKIIAYDTAHNSEYVETLHQFLLNNGSIQAIASAMFCHRNTINYRVHNLRELFEYDLENVKTRFNLMTAFFILDYTAIGLVAQN